MGKASSGDESQPRKSTRTTQVVEVELRSPVKFEKPPKEAVAPKEEAPGAQEQAIAAESAPAVESLPEVVSAPSITEQASEDYTVQKGDTLQKISQKLYGTTKKWVKIFEMNKEALKGPNKIYPGQVIKVPAAEKKAPLEETKENLK
jgi:nucleoid-associated protein YgaU